MYIPSFSFTSGRRILFAMVLAAMVLASVSFTLFASAEVGPEITTTIRDSGNSTITQAPLGSVVHARAHVATTTASTTPTGTVDFTLYANLTCAGTPTTQAGVTLSGGVAESATTSLGAAGLSYIVRYNGDSDNAPSEGTCTALVATAPNVSISTDLSSSTIRVGTFVHDTATLNNETASASGTVTYTVYTNSSCTAGAQSAGSKTVSSGSVPNSDSIQFNTPGTYYWQAVYSGDQHNAAATSTCSSEKLRVFATSTPIHHNDDDEDDENDGDKGKHKGFVEGLPFGIFKKMVDDEYVVPPGIIKRFLGGDFFQNIFHKDEHADKNKNTKEQSNNGQGKGKGHND